MLWLVWRAGFHCNISIFFNEKQIDSHYKITSSNYLWLHQSFLKINHILSVSINYVYLHAMNVDDIKYEHNNLVITDAVTIKLEAIPWFNFSIRVQLIFLICDALYLFHIQLFGWVFFSFKLGGFNIGMVLAPYAVSSNQR